jgi:alkaline phosphatase D
VKTPLRRRDLLLGAAAGAAGLVVLVPATGLARRPGGSPPPSGTPVRFEHGVASGDPLPDGILLWTRVTPAAEPSGRLEVQWQLASDRRFHHVLAEGVTATDATRDFTVKVDVRGLPAGRTLYYRFRAGGAASPTGRTRTAPRGGQGRLRFAVVSCSSLAHGHFHVYRSLAARRDLDAVLHLGDYIYEYATGEYGAVRAYEPAHEIVSLADYRARHAQYKRDPDLQAAHRQHPFVTVWDDHESANDAWSGGAENHQPGEGAWEERKAAAARAYSEWMPIRDSASGAIHRVLHFGDLADVVMLDTRIAGRDRQVLGARDPRLADPSRSLLGPAQEAWLEERLAGSRATWKLLGQQVMMAQLPLPGGNLNVDAWDGYPAARARLYQALRRDRVEDVAVLTGDIHTSWAAELTENPWNPAAYDPATGRGALAVEFVTPAVTSPGLSGDQSATERALLAGARHLKYVNLTRRGYVVLDVTRERLQAAWFHLDDVVNATATESFAAAFAVARGTSRLVREEAPAAGLTAEAADVEEAEEADAADAAVAG